MGNSGNFLIAGREFLGDNPSSMTARFPQAIIYETDKAGFFA